jgi:hypothetical protein
MSQTVLYKTAAGFQNVQSGVYSDGEGMILSAVTSSQASNENRAKFFFNTADSNTQIPSNAIIDSFTLSVWVASHWNDPNIQGAWVIYVDGGGNSGTNIFDSNWLYPYQNYFNGAADWTNGQYNDLANSTGFALNRAGYTNFGIYANIMEGGDPMGWYVFADFYKNDTESAKLTINWHLPDSGPRRLTRITSAPRLTAQRVRH